MTYYPFGKLRASNDQIMITTQIPHRLFIGMPLSEEAQRGVEGVMDVLKKKHWKVRWNVLEDLHVTGAFLGEAPSSAKATAGRRKYEKYGRYWDVYQHTRSFGCDLRGE
jgi:hypothetical protein